MKYGFTVPGRGPLAEPDSLITIAQRAEELGYDSISMGDHILVPRNIQSTYPYTEGGEFPGGATGASMEQLTALAFIAGATRTIKLVTSVMIVPHRNPLVAAKALATLDVLSKGRLVVGIGVGWMREEFEALDLPPFEERGAVTDEYIQAFKELWTSDNPTFEGKYCGFSNITFLPKPVQKPHPPIWVGGESRRAIRRAAWLCDAWYPIGSNPQFPMGEPEQLAEGMQRLATYAESAGRDPSEIEVVYRTHNYELRDDGSVSSRGERQLFTGTADQIAADVRQYQDMGVNYLVVDFARMSSSLDEMLGHMENTANRVVPRV
jgi:probable F420-dependent oxidoreductase